MSLHTVTQAAVLTIIDPEVNATVNAVFVDLRTQPNAGGNFSAELLAADLSGVTAGNVTLTIAQGGSSSITPEIPAWLTIIDKQASSDMVVVNVDMKARLNDDANPAHPFMATNNGGLFSFQVAASSVTSLVSGPCTVSIAN